MEDTLPFVTSLDVGYRFNETSSERNSSISSVNFGNDLNRPSADQFASVVIAGPDNFDAADDRRLFIGDYLAVDPELSFSDPQAIVAAFNSAIRANNANPDIEGRQLPLVQTPSESSTAFFDITEKTHALYAQANFEGDFSNAISSVLVSPICPPRLILERALTVLLLLVTQHWFQKVSGLMTCLLSIISRLQA